MSTSDEFFNVTDSISTSHGERRLIPSTDYRGEDLRLIQWNAEALEAIFARGVGGAIVYIPPGRYYIGRTWDGGDPAERTGMAGV